MVTRYVFPNWTNYNKRVTILHSVQVRPYLYLEKEFYINLQLVRTKTIHMSSGLQEEINGYVVIKYKTAVATEVTNKNTSKASNQLNYIS